jgi:hypothetical protein
MGLCSSCFRLKAGILNYPQTKQNKQTKEQKLIHFLCLVKKMLKFLDCSWCLAFLCPGFLNFVWG